MTAQPQCRTMYQPAGTPSEQGENQYDAVPSYLSRLTRAPLLAAEEERALARRARRGDENAKKRLVEANMRLVINIAKHFRNRAIPFEDLVQEGAIGLMNAVERFDPDRGFRFSTYATHWIRQTIGRAIDCKAKAIRLPAHVAESVRHIERERARLKGELGRDPGDEELAEALGFSTPKLLRLLLSAQDPISLDIMVGEDESTPLGAIVADTAQADPEALAIDRDVMRHLQQILQDLTERERRVMRSRLGLEEGADGSPLRDISAELHLSRERVRQIEIQAIRKLRQLAQRRRMRDLFAE
ncbi:MAG: sigma-70 family RNA polymerase sigma factor [Armatimonadetes bacterium]|nr:sigma-70 family RNA polymerase sigma factor [Armatimonadota bacterium]